MKAQCSDPSNGISEYLFPPNGWKWSGGGAMEVVSEPACCKCT